MNIVYDTLLNKLPARRKFLPSGYISFNCPCCVAMGQPRPDTGSRGGIKLTPEGNLIINCFNCGFKTVWSEGNTLTSKVRFYLKALGLSTEEIRKVNFLLWQRKDPSKARIDYIPKTIIKFSKKDLPSKAMPFDYWLGLEKPPIDFTDVCTYLLDRGEMIFKNYEYYWSPVKKFKNRVIIPFFSNEDIVGWTARTIKNEEPRYYADSPPDYLFNNKSLYIPNRKFVILVEGAFDAIAIDGVACLGNKLSDSQISWIKRSGKEVILLPDREINGRNLVQIAIENEWQVSYPEWEDDVKDASDAVKKYGRLFTLRSVLENRTNNKAKIELLMKKNMR